MDIQILTVRNTVCSNLTAEQFADMMLEDMENARKEYDNIWYKKEYDRYLENVESQKNYNRNEALRYAEKHLKTERGRNKYVERQLANFVPREFKYRSISFFDFDVEPYSNGISNDCILTYDNLTKDAMIRCFERIKDNKYFKDALGWVLEDHHYSRPQIKLLLSDEMQALFDKEEHGLGEAIANFYSGTNYWGD